MNTLKEKTEKLGVKLLCFHISRHKQTDKSKMWSHSHTEGTLCTALPYFCQEQKLCWQNKTFSAYER